MCWPSGKYINLLYMYSILGWGSFCFNYCLNAAWHGGDQFVALLRWYGNTGFFDSGLQLICIFWSLFLIFLLTIPHRFSLGFGSGEFAGQSSTPTPWSFNQLLVLLAVWAGAKSCWKMKAGQQKEAWSSKMSWLKGAKNFGFQKTQLTNTSMILHPNHHRLWKLNTGLQATWAMSFSILPPDSRTLVSKWNTKSALIWKEDFGPLATVQFFFSLAQVRRLWTTIAKFLDTSVCSGSWCLDPSLSPFLEKFTILELILLDNRHKAVVLSVVVHLFLPHFFLPLNFLLMLGYSICEQPASLAMMLWLILLVKGVNDCSSGQLSDQQSSPWLCSEPNWDHFEGSVNFAGVLSW